MVRKLSVIDGGDSANDATGVRVILAGASDPLIGVLLDVDLAPSAVVPEIHAWHDRHRVPLVVDVDHTFVKLIVHVVREVLVSDPGHAVPDDSDTNTGA